MAKELELITQSAYAKRIGRAVSTVFRYVERGKLDGAVHERFRNGKTLKMIDPVKADELLKLNLDPMAVQKMANTVGKVRSPGNGNHPVLTEDQISDIQAVGIDCNLSMSEAQRMKTIWQAANEELKHRSASSELIDRAEVEKAAEETGIMIREGVLGMWDRISPLFAQMDDEHEITQLGIQESTKVLEALSRSL